jgi:hypothetical protein
MKQEELREIIREEIVKELALVALERDKDFKYVYKNVFKVIDGIFNSEYNKKGAKADMKQLLDRLILTIGDVAEDEIYGEMEHIANQAAE